MEKGHGALTEVTIGNTIVTGRCGAFGFKGCGDIECSDRGVEVCLRNVSQVLEARCEGRGSGVEAVMEVSKKGIIEVWIIRELENFDQAGGKVIRLTARIRKGLVIMEERVEGSNVATSKAIEGSPVPGGMGGQ